MCMTFSSFFYTDLRKYNLIKNLINCIVHTGRKISGYKGRHVTAPETPIQTQACFIVMAPIYFFIYFCALNTLHIISGVRPSFLWQEFTLQNDVP